MTCLLPTLDPALAEMQMDKVSLFPMQSITSPRGRTHNHLTIKMTVLLFRWSKKGALVSPLELKFSAESEVVMAEGEAHRVNGTRPNVLETCHGPRPLDMEPERPLCLPTSARTPLGVNTSESGCSELLLSGSNYLESLSNTESSCQTHARWLELLHWTSQVESYKQQQPGYWFYHTGLLPSLNCSVMESFFCHYLYPCLHLMRVTNQIKPQGKGPAQLNNQWINELSPLSP